ncbi:entericidin A/B family lipoprotein [Zavarzinia sp.]
MKKITLTALFAVAALVGACNTMEGAGRDVQKAGEAIESGARDVKNKL